jgi:hypothetical protein
VSPRVARRLAAVLIPAGLLLAPACSRLSPRTELEIGRHRVSLSAPRGWLYLDHGDEKRFRQDLTYVAVLDLGPVEGASYARELATAREHWRAAGIRVGYQETSRLLAPRALFPSKDEFELQSEYRRKVVRGYEQGDDALAEASYQGLVDLLSRLTPLGLDAVTELVLERVKFEPWNREVVSAEDVEVDHRPGRSLKTWNKRTHQDPQRLTFLVNGGNLLAVATAGDRYEASSAAFDLILDSLRFAASS